MSSSVNCFDYNCYRHSVDLFLNGTSLSEEGTTEGGPLAMPFLYALATVPLIKELSLVNVQQVWYADDSAAVGSLEDICLWWDRLLDPCPLYGYFPNPKKTRLLVKESYMNALQGRFLRTLVFLGLLRVGPILGITLRLCVILYRVCFFQSSVYPWFNSLRFQDKTYMSENLMHISYTKAIIHFLGKRNHHAQLL